MSEVRVLQGAHSFKCCQLPQKSMPMSTSMSTKTPTPNANKAQQEPQQGFSITEYFKGVKTEWTKITWPTRVQVISQTIVVLVMVAIMTLGLWLTDRILYDVLLCHVIPNGQERCYEQK